MARFWKPTAIFKIFRRYLNNTSQRLASLKAEDLDVSYLYDPANLEHISNNITCRKGVGDIKLVQELKSKLESLNSTDSTYHKILGQLHEQIAKIPNRTHPTVLTYGDLPRLVKTVGVERNFEFKPKEFDEIAKRLKLIRTDQMGNLSGSRSYFLLGELAELEQALIRYTVAILLSNKFQLFSVPDLLDRSIVESCGMNTRGLRNQVYTLSHNTDMCLSGTSEMALAGYFQDRIIPEDQLPLKVAAVSRCYRAETSSIAEERGIYRVHEFTKVEMFAVTHQANSDELLEDFRALQEKTFELLGLYFKVLDMPPHELGSPAYRKYDIEAWLPGRKVFGEISSCSNCTDYQSRRLNIKYKTADGMTMFAHTLNGTACAIPRMLISIVETYQNNNGTIGVPEVLQKFMKCKQHIGKQKAIPDLRLIKVKQ